MKHTNISLAGVITGLVITFGGMFRYLIMWPDPDKSIIVGIIGLLIIAVSWNYAGRLNDSIRIDYLENYISDQNYERSNK